MGGGLRGCDHKSTPPICKSLLEKSYLEFLNLLGKRNLNSGVLNCGSKLAKT